MSKNPKWKSIKTLKQAYELMDEGVLITWDELQSVSRQMRTDQQVKIIQHFVKNICEKSHDRLICEILTENLLLWLAHSEKDQFLKAAVGQFFDEPQAAEGCMKIVEIALSSEVTDSYHQDHVYAAAVLLICDVGKTIVQRELAGQAVFERSAHVLSQITIYLLSVSNINNYVIRLSLIHYFGFMAQQGKSRAEFERVLNRFGYTVLDFLFTLLFKKKSEGVALQYLLENVPFILDVEAPTQRILHEVFKYNLLKQPDRFSLFLQALGLRILDEDVSAAARKSFLQHLGGLLQVVARLKNKPLIYNIISCIYRSRDPYLSVVSEHIQREELLDQEHKDFARALSDGTKVNDDPLNFLRSHKRGRHPSFQHLKPLESFDQVVKLGALVAFVHQAHHAKAS